MLVLGLLFLYVARAISARTLAFKRTPLDLPWLAFLASASLSTLFAENQNTALFGTYSRYDGLVTLVTYASLFWLTIQTIERPGDARALLRVMLATGYMVAALAIIQSLTDSNRRMPASNHEVNLAKSIDRSLEERINRLAISNVAGQRQSLAACFCDFGGDLICRSSVHVSDHDLGAVLREAPDTRCTNPSPPPVTRATRSLKRMASPHSAGVGREAAMSATATAFAPE
jgi:hypothetical protein